MQFRKYHGSGNDFILIDNRQKQWAAFLNEYQNQPLILDHLPKNNKEYSKENITVFELCHRNMGIGADGLMLLQPSSIADFEMVYFNSDGHLSSMCGNGGRCIAHFAANMGLGNIKNEKISLTFSAPDGMHHALVDATKNWVELSMYPVLDIRRSANFPNAWVLNTGSPHFVEFTTIDTTTLDTNNKDDISFIQWGKSIRYNEEFYRSGINVNLVYELAPGHISIRTYERGVENETLSCGTGVTAAAIAYHHQNCLNMLKTTSETHPILIQVKSRGGNLSVQFETSEAKFENIVLAGPAMAVFTGEL